MIIIDLSQMMIANVMKSPDIKSNKVDDLLIRHMILNSIKAIKKTYSREFGEIVIATDSRSGYWRTQKFQHYKASRKDRKKNDFLPWNEIYQTFNAMVIDLKENFPYKVLNVPGCEADDIIGTLSKYAEQNQEKTLIVGTDKDYIQLHSDYVSQYCPRDKIIKKSLNPSIDLCQLILNGDTGDGIPNIKSDLDTFVNPFKRQASMFKKDTEEWSKDGVEGVYNYLPENLHANFKRNRELIDLTMIPNSYKEEIIKEYQNPPLGNKTKIMQYLIDKKMRLLISDIGDF